MLLHEKIKELRLQNNLSQEKLARKLNITTRNYIYYEKGHKYPSVKLLDRIAQFFNVSISYLMDEQNEFVTNAQTELIMNAQAHDGKYEKLGSKHLIEEISRLFTGNELSETEKDDVMEALLKVYWKAKKKNRQD